MTAGDLLPHTLGFWKTFPVTRSLPTARLPASFLHGPVIWREFCEFWSARSEARKIWFSLFTPQENQLRPERLSAEDRVRAVSEIAQLRTQYAKVDMPQAVLDGFLRPPASPRECIFAQVTACISADLATTISPCQFGGRPVCSECGCIASAGLAAIGRHKLAGLVPVSTIFAVSQEPLGDQCRCEQCRHLSPRALRSDGGVAQSVIDFEEGLNQLQSETLSKGNNNVGRDLHGIVGAESSGTSKTLGRTSQDSWPGR